MTTTPPQPTPDAPAEEVVEALDVRRHPAWNFVFRELDSCLPPMLRETVVEYAADNAVQRLLNEGLLAAALDPEPGTASGGADRG